MRVYTKTGDKGETSLVGGKRMLKNSSQIEAYGTVDELNSLIGMLLAEQPLPFLTNIQQQLFELGGMLATEPENWEKYWKSVDIELYIKKIELEIDHLSENLEALHTFLLPQGSRKIALTHLCRTVCRRAERRIVSLRLQDESYLAILVYFNRLSDFLFVLARYFHTQDHITEIPYIFSK
jgi:cob(I)alamin adenosyltransferase